MTEVDTMEDNSRFTYLFNRYLANEATPEEENEFMKLIHDGSNDELIKNQIDSVLEEKVDDEDMSLERAQVILSSIVKDKHPKTVSFRPWHWAAAAAVLLLCISGLWLFNTQVSNQVELADKNETPNKQLANQTTTYTGKQFIVLPDGSTVMLDDNSKLTHTVDFNGTLREVMVEGQAYFDIAHNPAKPFKAHIGEYVITVLGTAFNVDAPVGVEQVKVTVTRGKVAVGKGEKVYELLTPNQEIAINTSTDIYDTHSINAEQAVAWQKDYFILNNVSMQEAVDEISLRFKMAIEIENEELKACKVSARFIYRETLDEVLTFITGPREAEFERKDGKIIIKGGNGCINE